VTSEASDDPFEDLDEILDRVARHLLGDKGALDAEAQREIWKRGGLVCFEALAIPIEQRRRPEDDRPDFDLPSVCQALRSWSLIGRRYGCPSVRYWHQQHEPEPSRASYGAVTGWRMAPEGLYLSGVTCLAFIQPGWSVSVGTWHPEGERGHVSSFAELSIIDETVRGGFLDAQVTSVGPSAMRPDEVTWLGELESAYA
jgi:hypothetical protein